MNSERKLSRRELFTGAVKFAAASAALSLFDYGKVADAAIPAEVVRSGLVMPHGVAVTPDGRLLVADSGNYRIQIFSPMLNPIDQFGKPGFGPGRLNYPCAVAVAPDGVIYVVDTNNSRICRYSSQGEFSGDISGLGGAIGSLFTPQGVCIAFDGSLIVTNTRGHNVQVFDPLSGEVKMVWGMLGDDPPQITAGDLNYTFRLPTDCCQTPDGRIWILDSGHGRIVVVEMDGRLAASLVGLGLKQPQSMCAVGEMIYICDTGNARICKLDQGGKLLAEHNRGLIRPSGITGTSDGRLVITDEEAASLLALEAF